MKEHRIRNAEQNKHTHIFTELYEDTWAEILMPLDKITHKAIHEYIDRQCELEKAHLPCEMLIADRAFGLGLIRDWKELIPIKDEGE